MHELYELKEKLMEELEKYGAEELTAGSLEVVDKLSHAIKNLHKIIEKCEEEEEYSMDDGMMGGGMSYARGGNQGGGNRGGQGGGRSNRSYRGYAYARGRGRNARRDSMGRYARDEYSMADSEEMVQELRELMEDAPDEKTKKEFQKFIQKIEMM